MAIVINEKFGSVRVANLQEHPANPRRGDVEATQESIEINGFYGTVVVQRSTGYIIVGNHRYRAAKEAGLERVPVAWVDVDDEAALRIMAADNRTSDLGGYDNDALSDLLRRLAETEIGVSGTGYDDRALANITSGNVNDITEDTPPPAPAKPTTRRGDIWTLGEHRLICGDATIAETYAKLLPDDVADLVVTDPPYNVDIVGGSHALTPAERRAKGGKEIANDAMTFSEFENFLRSAFELMNASTKAGGAAYIFHADSSGETFRRTYREAGWDLKQVLQWVKNSFVIGRQDYQWQHEPILYGWKPGAAHEWFGMFDKGTVIDDAVQLDKLSKDELREMLDQIHEASTVLREDRPGRNLEHPTMKPVKLCGRLVANSTESGAIVLDPFAGSGSTMMACEHLGRRAHMIEIDPAYCDVIVQRWETATDGKAKRGRK